MKFFASSCLFLVICQLGGTSILPGQIEKEKLEDVSRYNSALNTVLPTLGEHCLLTSCNGVLNSTSGGIAYKASEPIAANERCVWTIRGGKARGFTLNVLNLGISNSSVGTQVIATCLLHGSAATHILLTQTGLVNGVSSCNILLITFASGSDVGDSTGFALDYAVTRSSSLSSQSKDYIVDAGAAAIIRHPHFAAAYENYEQNTFVILPAVGSNSVVLYLRGTLEGSSCADRLRVYRFNATSVVSTKWQYEGNICGNIKSDLITHNDLILITFDTDGSVVGTGFQLAVAANGESQCLL